MNGSVYEKGRAWIEVDMSGLGHNLQLFQRLLPKRCALMPAVKANAYGHGAVLVAKELERLGVHDFCVAGAAEGAMLREAGVKGQILILGYTHPKDFDLLHEYGLTQTVVDCAYGKELEAFGRRLLVHVGIDTGMHRLGESWEHFSWISRLWDCEHLQITGVFSHLCTSDGVTGEDRAYMCLQETRFLQVVRCLRAEGKTGFSTHLQGSYGILNGNGLTGTYDYARAGIALYGVFSERSENLERIWDLRPVLSLKARIECVREVEKGEGAGYGLAWHADSAGKLAAVSIGYADGLPRTLSNRGHGLVRGKRVPIAGRICMDQLLLDVTDVPGVRPGDEVILIGKSGKEEIRAEELAAKAGTISNEILSRLGARLARVAV